MVSMGLEQAIIWGSLATLAVNCSRVYSAARELARLADKLGAECKAEEEEGHEVKEVTRWDALPFLPILIQRGDARVIVKARWGLLYRDSKTIEQGTEFGYNARSETLDERPTFRDAAASRRCVVLVEAFLEPWNRRMHKVTRADGETLMLAGLWEPPRLTKEPTFTIVTIDSNDLLWEINDRMPVVIQPDQLDGWLRDGDRSMLTTCDSAKLLVEDIGPSAAKRKDPPGQTILFGE